LPPQPAGVKVGLKAIPVPVAALWSSTSACVAPIAVPTHPAPESALDPLLLLLLDELLLEEPLELLLELELPPSTPPSEGLVELEHATPHTTAVPLTTVRATEISFFDMNVHLSEIE
jgi:hypothetical protein